jgi:hypothetical protein
MTLTPHCRATSTHARAYRPVASLVRSAFWEAGEVVRVRVPAFSNVNIYYFLFIAD